ncbi:hypothetical protein FGO68_gene1302 [Halteria grandinella]|uniref:Peptidase M1 membrane alanine aminopeptidase domain-containing protein n=1 Tax=Halteria grandinella TaxID=5974 RepID=A0A8J8NUL1_HALGN|nr:hypothetical protein FGO68_gene1302 [Halteria grandinella]
MARWCTCLSQISVQVAVPEPDQLQSIFDTISYAKGSAICRMLYTYIGDDALFFKCLKAYMEKFAYVYIGICSQRSIRSQSINECFPRVKLERTSPTTYTLTQSLQDTDTLWPIPIFYHSIPQGLESFTLLTQQSQTLEIPPETEALCLNSNCTGFFITDYDDTTLHTLIVNNKQLSQAGRFSLLHDILFMSGSLNIEWLLYFTGETSISVWQTWHEQIKKQEFTEEVQRCICIGFAYLCNCSWDIIRDQEVTYIALEYLRRLIIEGQIQMIRIPPDLRISNFKIGQKDPEMNEALLEAVKNLEQKWY